MVLKMKGGGRDLRVISIKLWSNLLAAKSVSIFGEMCRAKCQ